MSDKFAIRKVQITDIFHVRSWLNDRKLPTPKFEDIPKIGFMCLKDGVPIAAAFLRTCEGKVGWFDSLVSNPAVALYTRHLAIEALIDKILLTAKENGFNRVIAFSIDDGTIRRSEKRGFIKQKHTVISLVLPNT
jgi:hypothetical protein